jgi:hypothetical protein
LFFIFIILFIIALIWGLVAWNAVPVTTVTSPATVTTPVAPTLPPAT